MKTDGRIIFVVVLRIGALSTPDVAVKVSHGTSMD
jgi:hypothetical protein